MTVVPVLCRINRRENVQTKANLSANRKTQIIVIVNNKFIQFQVSRAEKCPKCDETVTMITKRDITMTSPCRDDPSYQVREPDQV